MKLYICVLPRLKSWLGAKPGVTCGNNSCQLKGGAGSKGDASSSQSVGQCWAAGTGQGREEHWGNCPTLVLPHITQLGMESSGMVPARCGQWLHPLLHTSVR